MCRKISSENRRSPTVPAAMKLREQAVADGAGGDEVADQRAVEYRQRVEPLRGRDQAVLRQPVPHQPEPADARCEQQPHGGDAGEPRIAPEMRISAKDPFAQQVQRRDEHERVGRVAVQAPRERPHREVVGGQPFDRRPRTVGARVEADVDVDPGDGDDPEQEVREPAQVPPWIRRLAERAVECGLDAIEQSGERGGGRGAPRRHGRRSVHPGMLGASAARGLDVR
jgi:hypothetical protein